jgi:hypothetical protein
MGKEHLVRPGHRCFSRLISTRPRRLPAILGPFRNESRLYYFVHSVHLDVQGNGWNAIMDIYVRRRSFRRRCCGSSSSSHGMGSSLGAYMPKTDEPMQSHSESICRHGPAAAKAAQENSGNHYQHLRSAYGRLNLKHNAHILTKEGLVDVIFSFAIPCTLPGYLVLHFGKFAAFAGQNWSWRRRDLRNNYEVLNVYF